MIKAVIFDFDGTIADTVPAIREGVNRTMRLYGYPEHTEREVLSFINYGARNLVRSAMPEDLRSDDALVDRVLKDYDRCYSEVCLLTDRAYDGIPELVERLHQNYLIGVLSNKQDVFVKQLSSQVLLPGTFDAAQGVAPGTIPKPDPCLPRMIASALGVTPEECAMVGDSDVDLQTALNSGMLHIGVSWGYRSESFLRASGATLIAHTPDEVEEILGRG